MGKRSVILLLLQIVAIFTFSIGFFPQKSVLQGDASFLYLPQQQSRSDPVFSKLVLVVIDALRSDFLFQESNSKFNFVHQLLNDGAAWGYTAYSNPPTVTLPRLKGITTGSTPNFLDAILNVAEDDLSSSLNDQDSWLRQFHNNNKRIKFFGDDTWLKLFPLEFFQEYEGTNSFFVSDFEQVDLNVTRHLPHQFSHKDEWDVLILHYLGLDHIGHKGGSSSRFMPGKQEEMDNVIKQIYESMDGDTLLCVMGDHGMNDLGNHGGSSNGETSAALTFISPKLKQFQPPVTQRNAHLPLKEHSENYKYLDEVQQIDLVPTLASLFNLPIPKNSLGIIITDFLQLFPGELAEIKITDNFHQLMNIIGETPSDTKDIQNSVEEMKRIQSTLAKATTNYNYQLISIGYILLLLVTVATTGFTLSSVKLNYGSALLLGVSFTLGISTFGSSFVEEEQQLWWWISTGILLLSAILVPQEIINHLLVFTCLRLIRGWNNSGQKFIYDCTLYELLKVHTTWNWALNALTIFVTSFTCTLGERGPLSFVSSFLLATLCLVYKGTWSVVNGEQTPQWLKTAIRKSCILLLDDTDNRDMYTDSLVPMARLFFQITLALILFRIALNKLMDRKTKYFKDIHSIVSMILILQTSSANIPQFLVFWILQDRLKYLLTAYTPSDCLVMVISLILQNLTFFQFGGTNSIATVNLTNAYNGISGDYNIHVVGLLMCIGNFAPSIYWSMATLPTLFENKKKTDKWEIFFATRLPALVFYSIIGCFIMGSCVILRYHLFIWSVFSPKLCYYVTWNVFMNFMVSWCAEGLLVALY